MYEIDLFSFFLFADATLPRGILASNEKALLTTLLQNYRIAEESSTFDIFSCYQDFIGLQESAGN